MLILLLIIGLAFAATIYEVSNADKQITDLGEPVVSDDAATKNYTDNAETGRKLYQTDGTFIGTYLGYDGSTSSFIKTGGPNGGPLFNMAYGAVCYSIESFNGLYLIYTKK